MGRLTFVKCPKYWNTGRHPTKYTSRKTFQEVVDRLAHYEDMEEQGRLVVPTIRVGDTVWTNISVQGDRYRKADRPYLTKVVYIGIGEETLYFHVEYSNGRVFPFDFNEIGKTVFLTQKEAENALSGLTTD